MEDITQASVEKYLKEGKFDLLPTQAKISFPVIKRYVQLLREGKEPLPIKIADEAIVDGHHRYISGHIFGSQPPSCDYIRPAANIIRSWDSVTVESTDFGNR
jgi:hypothetical protein